MRWNLEDLEHKKKTKKPKNQNNAVFSFDT